MADSELSKQGTFVCGKCGVEFDKARSDRDAEAEAARELGVPNAATNANMVLVCEDCYATLMRASKG